MRSASGDAGAVVGGSSAGGTRLPARWSARRPCAAPDHPARRDRTEGRLSGRGRSRASGPDRLRRRERM